MRRTLRRWLSSGGGTCLGAALPLVLSLALAGTAVAAPLASASLSLSIGAFPTATFPGAGATGSATSSLSASLGGAGVFNGAFTTVPTTGAAPPISTTQIVITKNAAGTFTGATPGQLGGSLAIEGAFNLYGIGGGGGGGAPLLSVPLKIGTPNTIFQSGGGVSLTAIASGWTVGTAAVTIQSGSAPASFTAMGSNGLTPGGAGTVLLVTPLKILTNVAGEIPAFGALTLTYVPEPATAALLGLGAATLAALGRRRR